LGAGFEVGESKRVEELILREEGAMAQQVEGLAGESGGGEAGAKFVEGGFGAESCESVGAADPGEDLCCGLRGCCWRWCDGGDLVAEEKAEEIAGELLKAWQECVTAVDDVVELGVLVPDAGERGEVVGVVGDQ